MSDQIFFNTSSVKTERNVKNVPKSPFDGKGVLDQKVVVITGASSGIGKAMAYEFSSRGCCVVLASRNYLELEKIADDLIEMGRKVIPVITDVDRVDDCERLIKRTLEAFGRIDVLINNAGISMRASFSEVKLSVLERLMQTNFWGAVYCSRFALPHLLKTKGSLVAISSITGIVPLPGRTGYVASKHALDGFMDTVRIENMKKDLHVLVVHAGFTSSNIRKTALNKDGLPQEETPRDELKMMSAEAVAKIVAEAVIHRKNDLVLTLEGKIISWLYKRLPRLADKLIYNEMAQEQKALSETDSW